MSLFPSETRCQNLLCRLLGKAWSQKVYILLCCINFCHQIRSLSFCNAKCTFFHSRCKVKDMLNWFSMQNSFMCIGVHVVVCSLIHLWINSAIYFRYNVKKRPFYSCALYIYLKMMFDFRSNASISMNIITKDNNKY